MAVDESNTGDAEREEAVPEMLDFPSMCRQLAKNDDSDALGDEGVDLKPYAVSDLAGATPSLDDSPNTPLLAGSAPDPPSESPAPEQQSNGCCCSVQWLCDL